MTKPSGYEKQRKIIRNSLNPNSTCVYCNCYFTLDSYGKKSSLTIDHIVPQSKGGTHDLENLVPACMGCNTRKSSHEDKIILFKLATPKRLSDGEYDNISRYLNSLNRKMALERVLDLVKEDQMEEAIKFVEELRTVRPGNKLFQAIVRVIQRITNSLTPILMQVKKILQEVNSMLLQEVNIFNDAEQKVKHLKVIPYSLVA